MALSSSIFAHERCSSHGMLAALTPGLKCNASSAGFLGDKFSKPHVTSNNHTIFLLFLALGPSDPQPFNSFQHDFTGRIQASGTPRGSNNSVRAAEINCLTTRNVFPGTLPFSPSTFPTPIPTNGLILLTEREAPLPLPNEIVCILRFADAVRQHQHRIR